MFYRASFKPRDIFLYGIYKIQYQGESPLGRQLDLIQKFDEFISGQAHPDCITVPGKDGFATQVWLSYWWPDSHKEWWPKPAVKEFWHGLPEDAGISPSRVQNACTAELKNGLNDLGYMEPFSDKIGYWGCVRHRIPNVSLGDKLASSLEEMPSRVPETSDIRLGRTLVTGLPDNICFLVEGHLHTRMPAREKDLWFEEFDELVTGWMEHLAKDTGLVNLSHNRKIEMYYWMDMSKLERAGRVHRGHIKLRKRWMETYGPGGEFAFCCGYNLADWDGFLGLFRGLREAVGVDEGLE